MGAWGYGIYENDTSADAVCYLEDTLEINTRDKKEKNYIEEDSEEYKKALTSVDQNGFSFKGYEEPDSIIAIIGKFITNGVQLTPRFSTMFKKAFKTLTKRAEDYSNPKLRKKGLNNLLSKAEPLFSENLPSLKVIVQAFVDGDDCPEYPVEEAEFQIDKEFLDFIKSRIDFIKGQDRIEMEMLKIENTKWFNDNEEIETVGTLLEVSSFDVVVLTSYHKDYYGVLRTQEVELEVVEKALADGKESIEIC